MKNAVYLTPVVTAFDEKGNLDIPANQSIWEHLINGGVNGLVVLGSIGEFFSMKDDQKREIIKEVTSYVNKRIPVYIGTSCMRIEDTIELSNFALESGADAVMVISPYYFSLSNESVEYFYDKVAEGVKGDIYLYNFPDRTGYDLSPEVTLNLLRKHKNIVGYKDTLGGMAHTRKLITTVSGEFPDFKILCGFDENFARNVTSGGDGCIGGLSNIYPEVFAEWVKAVNDKDMEKVSLIQRKVDKMMNLYDIGTPFIPIIKRAMIARGIKMNSYCIEPFMEATADQTAKIEKLIKEIETL